MRHISLQTCLLIALTLAVSGCQSLEGMCEDGCEIDRNCRGKTTPLDQCTKECVTKMGCLESKVSADCWSDMDAANLCLSGLSCVDFEQFTKNIGKEGDYPCKAEFEAYQKVCGKEEVESAYKGCP